MNTRRLTKKYKHKSRSNRSKRRRRTRRRGRRVLKGGVIPRGVVVRRSSGNSSASVRPSSASIRPSVSGISKLPKLDFKCFYNKLMKTNISNLPSTIECEKDNYVCNTTFQTFQPKGAYLNMTGLKFVNYLRDRYKNVTPDEQKKIRTIVSLFDQCSMSQGIRISDLPIVQGQVSEKYFACYKDLYEEIYKKLFPNGNSECFPVSTSAIIHRKHRLQTVHEGHE
jgi:hypothetical protein